MTSGKIERINSWLRAEDGLHRLMDHVNFSVRRNSYVDSEKKGNHGTDRFAHVTYVAATNAGDTVLSQCVRQTMQTAFLIKEWQLIPVKGEVADDLIASINECDKLIIGGGGLFLPDTNENSVSG